MTKITVFGATGFIGRNVCEHFAGQQNYQVKAAIRHRPPFFNTNIFWTYCNLNDEASIANVLRDTDIVIQMAAFTGGLGANLKSPASFVAQNASMNSLLFDHALQANVKHVIFPSCTVMLKPSPLPQSENDYDPNYVLHPAYQGPGMTKVFLEKMCEYFSKLGNTKFTVLRQSNIYGPYDKFDLNNSHVFAASITKVLNSLDNKVTVWGDGSEKRDLLYVSDLVDAIQKVIEKQTSKFELFNIGYGSSISIRDLVTKINQISNMNKQIVFDTTKPTVKTDVSLDCTKAKTQLGWEPKTNLDDGIKNTIEFWHKKNTRRF